MHTLQTPHGRTAPSYLQSECGRTPARLRLRNLRPHRPPTPNQSSPPMPERAVADPSGNAFPNAAARTPSAYGYAFPNAVTRTPSIAPPTRHTDMHSPIPRRMHFPHLSHAHRVPRRRGPRRCRRRRPRRRLRFMIFMCQMGGPFVIQIFVSVPPHMPAPLPQTVHHQTPQRTNQSNIVQINQISYKSNQIKPSQGKCGKIKSTQINPINQPKSNQIKAHNIQHRFNFLQLPKRFSRVAPQGPEQRSADAALTRTK